MRQETQKIVVTGGAGFIGGHLVDRLLRDERVEVVVLDNLSRGRLANLAQHRDEPRLQFVHGDVRDPALLAPLLRGASVVYHLAAQSTVMGAVQDVEYSFATNVVGTFNVLRAASQAEVGRLVFSSSREVYGEPIDMPVEESQPLLAINCYGASKVMGEAYCRAFRRQYGLDCVILRLANVYGPRDIGRVIPVWLERAASSQDLDVYGGKQLIDFVWVAQVVEGLVHAAETQGPLPPINIGSGTGTPILSLAKRIAWLAGGRSRIHLLPARTMEVTRFVAGVDRMRKLLHIDPPIEPLDHLPSLLQPIMSQPVPASALG